MADIRKYQTLFEEAPIALWEEDFSEVKTLLDETVPKGTDLETYLNSHPELIKNGALKVRIIDFNQQAVILHEAISKEHLRENLSAVLSEDSYASFKEQLIAIWEGRTECETVGEVRTLRGETRYVRFKWMAVTGHRSRYDRVFVSTQDITEQHLTHEKLRAREAELRSLMRRIPGLVFKADMKAPYEVLFATGGSKHLSELARLKKGSRNMVDHIHPDDLNRWSQSQEVLLKEGLVTREYRIIDAHGKHRWVLEQSRIEGKAGDSSRWFEGILTDITSQVDAEDKWRQTETMFRNLFNAISDPVFVYPIDSQNHGTFIEVNSFAEEVYGYTKSELLSMEPKELLPRKGQYTRQHDDRRRRLHQESTIVFQNTHRKKDGTLFPVEVASSAFTLDDRKVIISIVRDLSERKKMDKERRQWGRVLEQATESIIITDTQGQIEYVNSAFEALTGYSKDEVLGRNPRILNSGKQPKDFYKELWHTILTGNVWRGRMVNRRKDGTVVTEEGSISPVRDEFGSISHFVAVKKNVTKEVQLEKKLQQAQKMEAVGRLAGGIAHDFNNVLTAIMGYAEILKLSLKENPRDEAHVTQILNSANRAKELVRHILSFSRGGSKELAPIHVLPIMREAVKFIRSALPSSIELWEEVEVQRDIILGNATNIHQIVMNLCTNAQQAMTEKGGQLRIALRQVELGDPVSQGLEQLAPGPHLVLSVIDTGPGIDENHLSKIFDPFFTTKEVGKGTGLGLSVVHGIVHSHKGEIKLESKVGEGTSISVYFPITEREPKPEKEKKEYIPGGTETIMVIDDEPSVGDSLKIRLEALGYSVTVFDSPSTALKSFQQSPEKIDLVITDMTMPQLSGLDVALDIHRIRQELPVILCTGYHETMNRQKALQHGIDRFFLKPIPFRKLGMAIRDLLDSKSIADNTL